MEGAFKLIILKLQQCHHSNSLRSASAETLFWSTLNITKKKNCEYNYYSAV